MRIAYPLPLLMSLTCLVTPVFSAEKSMTAIEVSGKVLMTTDRGALPLKVGQTIPDGSNIFVGEDAVARLAKADTDCDVFLPSGQVTAINTKNICDVQITPTATEASAGGLPPPVVGLAFFATVITTAGIVTLTSNGSTSAPP